MRGFFLLLLLTNVVFFAWQYSQSEKAAQRSIYEGVKIQNNGLTLLDDVPKGEQPELREGVDEKNSALESRSSNADNAAPAVTDSSQDAMIGGRYCARISGIGKQEIADRLGEFLKEIGAVAIEHGSEQAQSSNFWVMLPPYRSREKAAEAAAILKKRRIRDFFIIRSGEHENAVSLGVFSTKERAEARYKEIIALKARLRKPKIIPRGVPQERYWISYEIKQLALQQKITAELSGYNGTKVEETACK